MQVLLHAMLSGLLLTVVSVGPVAAETSGIPAVPPVLDLDLPRHSGAGYSSTPSAWSAPLPQVPLSSLPYGSGYEARQGQRAEAGTHRSGAAAAQMGRRGAGRGQ